MRFRLLWILAVLSGPAFAATPDSLGLFSGENSYFALLANNTESTQDIRFQFGYSHSAFFPLEPIAGNFDGVGGDTVGAFDRRSNEFFLKYSNGAGGLVDTTFVFGAGTVLDPLVPLAGDWTGIGRDTVGVFDFLTATFQLKNSNSAGPADMTFQFGDTSAWPLAGDWTGIHKDTIGTYNPVNGTAKLRNSNTAGAADITFVFKPVASTSTIAVAGDWNGDGIDTLGIFDPDTDIFYIRNSNTTGSADQVIPLQKPNWKWQLVAGKWRSMSGAPESTGYAWPTATPQSEGFDPVKLDAAYANAAQVAPLRSLLVFRHGNLVREAYFHGARPELANNIHSASKSVLSALVGIAQSEGTLGNLDAPISTFLPAAYFSGQDARLSMVTLTHLLTMSAGFSWDDTATLATMILTANDYFAYILSRPFAANPGAVFNYNTGLTHVMARILTDKTGIPLDQYAKQKLFDKLGVKVMGWGHDPMGYMQGGSEVWMKSRDMARFGYLYLKRGFLNGQQIVPAAWVDLSTSRKIPVGDGRTYGYWWWRPLGDTPGVPDVYEAIGHGGQYLFLVPSLDLLIVTTARGDTQGAELDKAHADISTIIGQAAASLTGTSGVVSVPQALDSVRVYPNPWRANRDAGHQITFDGFRTLTHTKIFTVAGEWVKNLADGNESTNWDLTTNSGSKAASGLYLYLMTTDDGQKKTGQVAIIK